MTSLRYSRIVLIISAILWSAFVIFIGCSQYVVQKQQAVAQALSEARGSYNKDLVYRRWIARYGGVYVAVNDDTPPNPYLQHLPNRDIVTEQGQKLTLINPAYMTRQVYELAAQQCGAPNNVTSLKPLRPQNVPDEWEKQCLEIFASNSAEIYSVETIDHSEYLRLIYPMFTEQRCLKCHAHQGYSVGDIRGGISVSVPLAPYTALHDQTIRQQLSLNGVIWAIGIIFFFIINKLQCRRLNEVNSACAAAKTSENKFRTLFDEAENGYDLLDFNTGEIVDCNQSFADLVGRPISELIGQSHTIIHPPAHLRDNVAESFVQVCNSPDGTLVVTQFITPEGVVRDVEIRAQRICIDGRQLIFGSIQDITQRKIQDDILQRLSQAVEQSPVAHILADTLGNIEQVNPKFTQMTGYTFDEVKGQQLDFIGSSGETSTGCTFDRQVILSDTEWRCELASKRKDGTTFWENISVSPVRDDQGTIKHYLVIREDITKHKRDAEKMEFLAHYDDLTGLPNLTLAKIHLHHLMVNVQQHNKMLAVLLVDLDHFRKFNELYGYEFGDELLQHISHDLQSCVADNDMVARMSGNKFAIFQDSITDSDQPATLAQKILDLLSRPLTLQNKTIYPSCSIGIALSPDDGNDVSDLMKNVEMAMFCAKEKGRNRYRYYAAALNSAAEKRYQLDEGIRNALKCDLFHLNYQPQIDTVTETINGFETLLRWNDPELGFVSPGDFIPVAEETDLILDIDKWVLRKACSQWMEWHQKGLKPVRMAINISGRQFKQLDFIATVTSVLQQTGMPAQWLEIELTEGHLMEGVEHTIHTLNALRELGVAISLDDFGTGYSSLRYLQQFPITTLKIDQSFISGLPHNKDNVAFTKMILSLVQHLELHTVAEGVELDEQKEFLQQHKCPTMQGYLFSRPLPAAELEVLLS